LKSTGIILTINQDIYQACIEGDTFNLEIAEIEKSSAPLKIEEDTNEELLARYMTLKQKIEDQK